MVDLYEVDLEARAEELAKLAGMDKEQVLAEIQKIINTEHRPPLIALIAWKARNSFRLGRGRVEMLARVIAIEEPTQTPQGNRVANVFFAYEDPETKETAFTRCPLWDERIEPIGSQLELDRAYSFKCSKRADGSLLRIGNIELLEEPAPIPKLEEVTPLPLENLVDAGGQYELIRGWIGRVITPREGTEPMGFEIAELESPLPVTVWFGGQYSRMAPADLELCKSLGIGDEVLVFGYVNLAGTNVSMRAIRVVKIA